MLPADYTAEHVTLGYALTVHKAQGVTVDRAVLVADSATTAEHLYVGMTRGRHENRVCVITDAATTGHGGHRPLEPTDVLAAVMRRSSAEVSATEKLRKELADSEDPVVLRRLWEQARTFIDVGAGPDRRNELRRLEKRRDDLPILQGIVAVKKEELGRTERALADARHDLVTGRAQLETLTRKRLFRRPDYEAIDRLTLGLRRGRDRLVALEHQRNGQAGDLRRGERRLADERRDIGRIPEVEAAVARRTEWLYEHPAEPAWEAELRGRLREDIDHEGHVAPGTERPDRQREYELGDFDIDLRTIDLGRHGNGCGLQRRLEDALGPARLREGADLPHPPLPGRGLDGPDFGP